MAGFKRRGRGAENTGRPIGPANRQKPFTDPLGERCQAAAVAAGIIADKLVEKGEDGDLAAIQQIADRLDGMPRSFWQQR